MSQKVGNLAVFADVRRNEAAIAAKTVARLASDAGVRLQVNPQQASKLGLNGALASDAFPQSADLLVSLGGDGTLLEAAHLAFPHGVPILGVDFGRTGFLTEVGRGEYEQLLRALLRDGIETVGRTALEARIEGHGEFYFAVNDIHIDRSHRGHILMFGIQIGDEKVADIPADGIVVSSPTGSTAYFLSAGGPIIAPGLDAFGIAPICPHTLFSRPLVVDARERIRISVPADGGTAQLYADGRPIADMRPGSAVEIVKAKRPMNFVRLDSRHFFKILERKLHWGTSIKKRRFEP